jgi:Arc-like DNA binding domain
VAKADTQTSLRLSEELRDRLATTAAAKGHGIGEEIRQRLEASFEMPAADDPKTPKLLAAIDHVAAGMILDGNWYDDLHLFQVFKVAVLTLLSRFEPSGASPNSHYLMSRPDDPPETVGRMYAGFAWRAVMNEKE